MKYRLYYNTLQLFVLTAEVSPHTHNGISTQNLFHSSIIAPLHSGTFELNIVSFSNKNDAPRANICVKYWVKLESDTLFRFCSQVSKFGKIINNA